MSKPFVHLHTHTEHSTLDGASKPKGLVGAATADGQTALGITDHGTMSGLPDFSQECAEQGVKLVPGMEGYMAREHVTDRPKSKKKTSDEEGAGDSEKLYYHLTLLAENLTGYHNLIKLSSRAYREGFWYRPRMDWSMMEANHDGLIATTGCLGGIVLQALKHDNEPEAVAAAARLQDIFGKKNLFVEIQDHGLPDQKRTMEGLLRVAKKLKAPLLAANDSHYVHKDDALSHDCLLCLSTGSKRADEKRFKFTGTEHYFKTGDEMWDLFPEADFPGACANTLLIADRSNVTIPMGVKHLPKFEVPDGYKDEVEYLQILTTEGAKKRWPNMDQATKDRLVYEMGIITDLGFPGYFLIVADLIEYAHTLGCRTSPGRGSVAGCAVAYALQITEVDPLRYKIPFERFLNPARPALPDIDSDFDTRYRDQIIGYLTNKYGADKVCQIVTYDRLKSRVAVRDATRVLGLPYVLGNQLVAAMPPLVFGKDVSLKDCYDPDAPRYGDAQQLRDLVAQDLDAKDIVDVALGIEGGIRHSGIHPGAVVISDLPLDEILPTQQKPKNGKPGPTTTQYDMHWVEKLGLLKLDCLGLKNLDIIDDCQALIKQTRGIDFEINDAPRDDQETFEMIQRGYTFGCFQVSSRPMRQLIRRLIPDCIEDMAALVALYRPGPLSSNMHNDFADLKHHRKAPTYFHPEAAELLKDTYGMFVYQEQLGTVAQHFAGYTEEEGFILIKAVAKKLPEEMAKEEKKFIDGCEARGYGKEFGQQLFQMVDHFSAYCFGLGHSVGYGILAYQTAYLKCHFGPEYMAALCSNAADVAETSAFLAEARARGIHVSPPKVSTSGRQFTVHDGGIEVGLEAVKGVGAGLAGAIVKERPFTDLADFVYRMIPRGLDMGNFVPLAQTGALDEFGHTRLGLVSVANEIFVSSRKVTKKESTGQVGMFTQKLEIPIPTVEYAQDQGLRFEKQLMGVYVSGHPLDGYEDFLSKASECPLADLADVRVGEYRWVAGIVSEVAQRTTKKNELMATLIVEDTEGQVTITAFPRNWANSGIREEKIGRFKVKKTAGFNSDEPDYVLQACELQPDAAPPEENLCRIYLPDGFRRDEKAIAQLKGILLSHRGTTPVALHLSKSASMRLDDTFLVCPDPSLRDDVRQLMKEFTG